MGGTELLIGLSIAMAAASASVSMAQSSAAADAERDAAERQYALQAAEAERQMAEVREDEREEKSDIIRRADRQLGQIRAVTSEIGATDGAALRIMAEVGATQGRDTYRIGKTAQRKVDAIQAGATADAFAATDRIKKAGRAHENNVLDAGLGFAGSALQIGGDYYARRQAKRSSANKRT